MGTGLLSDERTGMDNLFAYGTLMCDDIMQEISGHQLSCVPGVLNGYARRCVKGECYPAVVPGKKGRVKGIVYLNVPDTAWERLDRFEGEMYARQIVLIELCDGTTLPAVTYVLLPKFLDQLDHYDWDFAGFCCNGKTGFMHQMKSEQDHYKKTMYQS